MSFDPKKVYAMTENDNRQFADWVPLRMFDVPGALGIINLGRPEVVAYDNIMASQDMRNADYFTLLAQQPDFCRQINLTRTRDAGAGSEDTPGIVTIHGTDFYGNAISEILTPGATGVHISSTICFKTITAVIGSGWTQVGAKDTITLGWGQNLGVPYKVLTSDSQIKMCYVAAVAMLGTKYFTGTDPLKWYIDLSAGPYSGGSDCMLLVELVPINLGS